MKANSKITTVFASISLILVGAFYSPDTPIASADSTLTVFAASSMSEVLTKIGSDYRRANPGTSITFSFLASSALATQINNGAPADLFISASLVDIQKVRSKISTITPFLKNRVVIGVPKHSALLRSKDLNSSSVKWIQCVHTAPCGVAADTALAAERVVTGKPVSLEANASAVVAKVLAGEADAGIMYHTDVMAHSKELRAIGFRKGASAQTTYALGVIDSSANVSSAELFKAYIISPKVLTYLNHRGFTLISK